MCRLQVPGEHCALTAQKYTAESPGWAAVRFRESCLSFLFSRTVNPCPSIVTQSIKKLPAEDREWALNGSGFRRLSDDRPMELSEAREEKDGLFYKDCPYTTKKLYQRLIVTYSPKYAAYQKEIRRRQVERAEKMVKDGKRKTERNNPNDPARFVGKMAVTKDGEAAGIQYYLNEEKIAEEAR